MVPSGDNAALSPVEGAKAFFPEEMDMVQFVRSGGQLPPETARRMAPNFKVEFLPAALGGQIEGEGIDGMTEGWAEWLEPYESYVTRVEDFVPAGPEDVLVLVRVHARTRRDGVVVEHAPAAAVTIRDGVLVRIRFYLDRDEARKDLASSG